MSEQNQKPREKLFRVHFSISKKPDHQRHIKYRAFPLKFLVFAENYKSAVDYAEHILETDLTTKDQDLFIKSKKCEEIKYDAFFKAKQITNE